MIRSLMVALLTAVATSASAQWETTHFLPVPNTGVDADEVVRDGFSDFLTPTLPQPNPSYVTYDTIDFSRLRRGAPAALTTVFSVLSFNAKKMALAGFPKPKIEPVLSSTSGSRHYPIFWNTFPSGMQGTLAIQKCDFGGFPLIVVNDNTFLNYANMNNAWLASTDLRAKMVDYTSTVLTHELVHAVQGNGGTNWGCNRPNDKKWLTEGTADGIAHYLLGKRVGDAFRKYRWARNERTYQRPLYNDGTDLAYASGSFFRYLIEATEVGGVSDLGIMRDIIKRMTTSSVSSRSATLTALEKIIAPYTGDRPLAMVLSEFLTEYASYAGRYDQSDAYWVHRGFSGCVEYQITPGVTIAKALRVERNAARCLKVEWSGFTSAVALQIYLEGEGVDQGTLHLGEAVRQHSQLPHIWRCYDVVTKHLDSRLKQLAEEKCMLRRGATKGASTVNGWTSDFNLYGDGFAYFVLTNAAKDFANTQPATVNLAMGSILVRDETGATMTPRKDVPHPVRDGRTLMDSRVHAMAGGPGRLLFDGRSVFGDGLEVGFLDSAPGAGEIDGAAVVVRSGKYNVVLIKDKTGFPNGGGIMREPDGSFSGAITTLGMKGLPEFPDCGYKVPAELEILELSKERTVFRVSGDLFNLSRRVMMQAGQGGLCSVLKAARTEFKSIEVSLPWSANYDGKTEIQRAYPPMQDIYDEKEFRSGPSFGGIETSRSLAASGVLPDPSAPTVPTTDPPLQSSTTNSSSTPQACTCHCPDFSYPLTTFCADRCDLVFNQCPAPNSAAAQKADADLYREMLASRGIVSDIRDMLVSDIETMSQETRSQIIREYAFE